MYVVLPSFLYVFQVGKTAVVGILINCFLILIYCLISFLMNVSSTWFECSFCIIAGMIMAMFNAKVSVLLKSKKVVF